MKKPTATLRRLLRLRSRRAMARRRRTEALRPTRVWASWPGHVGSPPSQRSATIYQNGVEQRVILEGRPRRVPRTLSLRENWDETVSFLTQHRELLSRGVDAPDERRVKFNPASVRQRQNVRVGSYADFTTVKSITIPVALMLASEYDRVRQIIDWTPFAIDLHRWSPSVRDLLFDIGFLELAGVNQRTWDVLDAGSMQILGMRCGDTVDGEAIGDYLRALGIDPLEGDTRLYDAILEAVTNIVHHAYRDPALLSPHTVGKWWLAAAVTGRNDGTRQLSIAVYDHGASIPRTLPSWERYPMLKRMFASIAGFVTGDGVDPDPEDARYDGDAIKLAIEVGRTSRNEPNRGKGLDQIVGALELCLSGSIAIYSRQGAFSQIKGEAPQSLNRSVPIVGTLVVWNLTIGA